MNILYIVNNEIQYYCNKNDLIYTKKLPKNVIYMSKIANPKQFYKYFNQMLNDNKLHSYFINKKVKVIINDFYTKVDKIIIKDILEKLSFNKIIFSNEKEYLNLNNNMYINCNDEYFIIYYLDKYNKHQTVFGNTIFLDDYIKNFKQYSKIIFGLSYNLFDKFTSQNEYIVDKYDKYIINTVCKSKMK